MVLLLSIHSKQLLYFFSYKTEFFSFHNNPKNLDPSYKMDLDHWDCLENWDSIAKFCWIDLVIYSLSTERKTSSYSRRNTVLSGRDDQLT